MYNRYIGRSGRLYDQGFRGQTTEPPQISVPLRPEAERHEPDCGKNKPPLTGGSLSNIFGSLIPQGLDAGDLIILLILLLLYLESRDEEFLIILIITGYSMLRDRD